jgi:dethiobiotin synthetase
MSKGFFITGTDTNVGKTHFSIALVRALQKKYSSVAVMKPIASGGSYDSGELRNGDAESLLLACGLEIPYDLVNPYIFEAPVAPHLAAAESGVAISIPYIVDAYSQIAAKADTVVVEGVGGWQVPLNLGEDGMPQTTLADFAAQLKLPVIMVVDMRLGCLNHALLTVESIKRSKAKFYGWVANSTQLEMPRYVENIASLKSLIKEPLLVEIGFNESEQQTLKKFPSRFF